MNPYRKGSGNFTYILILLSLLWFCKRFKKKSPHRLFLIEIKFCCKNGGVSRLRATLDFV